MRLARLLPLAMFLVAAIACSDDDQGDAEIRTEVTRERSGIRLTLAVNDASYEVGETVQVTAEATNTLGEELEYGFASPGEPLFGIWLETELAGRQTLNPPAAPNTIAPNSTLPAGETVSAEAQWDQQLDTYETPVQAPEGLYVIVAELMVSAPGADQPISVSAAVEFELEGGGAIVSQANIIQRAIEQDEVHEWFGGRNSVAVCAIANIGTFYTANSTTGEVIVAPASAYDSQLANRLPICSPVTSGDEWRVIFFAPEGPDPNRISAYFTLDGDFLRVEDDAE